MQETKQERAQREAVEYVSMPSLAPVVRFIGVIGCDRCKKRHYVDTPMFHRVVRCAVCGYPCQLLVPRDANGYVIENASYAAGEGMRLLSKRVDTIEGVVTRGLDKMKWENEKGR